MPHASKQLEETKKRKKKLQLEAEEELLEARLVGSGPNVNYWRGSSQRFELELLSMLSSNAVRFFEFQISALPCLAFLALFVGELQASSLVASHRQSCEFCLATS